MFLLTLSKSVAKSLLTNAFSWCCYRHGESILEFTHICSEQNGFNSSQMFLMNLPLLTKQIRLRWSPMRQSGEPPMLFKSERDFFDSCSCFFLSLYAHIIFFFAIHLEKYAKFCTAYQVGEKISCFSIRWQRKKSIFLRIVLFWKNLIYHLTEYFVQGFEKSSKKLWNSKIS